MDVLLALFGFMLLFLVWFGPASWAARRGIGTRWTWLRGGIGGSSLSGARIRPVGYSGAACASAATVPFHYPSSGDEVAGFEPLTEPVETPVGYILGYGAMASIAFMMAAIFYKPKKQARIGLFETQERGLLNAGRTN